MRLGLTGARPAASAPSADSQGRLPGTQIFRSSRQYPEVESERGLLVLRIDSPIWFANVEAGAWRRAAVLSRGGLQAAARPLLQQRHAACLQLHAERASPHPHAHMHPRIWTSLLATPRPGAVKEFIRSNVDKRRALGDKSGDPVRVVVLDLSPVTDIDATGIHFLGARRAVGCCCGAAPGCRAARRRRPAAARCRPRPRPCSQPPPMPRRPLLTDRLCLKQYYHVHSPPPPAEDFIDELRDDGIQLTLGNPAKQVLLALKRAHLTRKIGRANIHIAVADAVARASQLAAQAEKEATVAGV